MYLKKKDLLEWVFVKISEYNQNEKDADAVCRFGEKERWRAKMQVLENMKRLVQSGAFDAPEHPVIQAIRDFQPSKDQQAGYDALVAWLESTTPFVLDSEKEEPSHDT